MQFSTTDARYEPDHAFPASKCWPARGFDLLRLTTKSSPTTPEISAKYDSGKSDHLHLPRAAPSVPNPVIYLLCATAVLAFYFRESEQAHAITVVLALNTLIGFVTG